VLCGGLPCASRGVLHALCASKFESICKKNQNFYPSSPRNTFINHQNYSEIAMQEKCRQFISNMKAKYSKIRKFVNPIPIKKASRPNWFFVCHTTEKTLPHQLDLVH
jgi:hypothetical protein